MSYPGTIAETVKFEGNNGDEGEAYYSRPMREGKFPGIVVVHHLPGWDEWTMEVVRKFAHHGYAAISPHLYFRDGPGSPDDVGARVRAAGGVADNQVVGDVGGAMKFLRAQANSSGKVGLIGFCSGGRHAYIAACKLPNVDALVDCWGGHVVVDNKAHLDAKRPVAPIDLTEGLKAPVLGLFGNDDKNPDPVQVKRIDETLTKLGKPHEFHHYDGAGHAFMNWARPSYRPDQAVDGWEKIFAFFKKTLSA